MSVESRCHFMVVVPENLGNEAKRCIVNIGIGNHLNKREIEKLSKENEKRRSEYGLILAMEAYLIGKHLAENLDHDVHHNDQ